jgi:LuxR family maltose regulon positive regulatory protein
LLDLLQNSALQRLILVKAPAGYGKTTLAVDWCEQLQRSASIVAWLSVDEDDNEPSAFAYHITKTLHRAAPSLGQSAIDLLAETKLIAPRNVVSAAINAVAESDNEVYLFLDDYHAIQDGRSHDLTAFLLRYAPSNFHLVIMTRTEPPLPISKLRLADEVAEFDVTGLRFSLNETTQFLGAELSPQLNSADISKLHEATEGWPAALQLARITLRNSSDPSKTVNSFSGASRKISTYIEDTLATQADDIVQFLLQTAILDRLEGSLCRAVTGIARSSDLLQELRHEQLLLVTLDEEGGWYRYHHLMSDYLIDRLHARMPDQVPELHRRAHRWFASHEMWNEAVQHAIAARDFDSALGYVEQCAMSLVIRGDLLTLLAWDRQLPQELMRGQAQVKLALAWGLALVSRLTEADLLLKQVEELARTNRTTNLWWRCRVCRAAWHALADESAEALSVGKDCLQYQSYDAFDTNSIRNAMRFGHWKAGEWGAFYALPKPDPNIDEATYVLAENYRLSIHGLVATHRLQIDDALRFFSDARALAEKYVGEKSVAAAIATGHLALLRYERGDISGAEISVLDELSIIETTVYHESFLGAYLVLVRTAILRDDRERAIKLLDRAERLAHERGWSRPVAVFLLERIRLLAREGHLHDAQAETERLRQIAKEHPAPERSSWTDIHISVGIAQALLAAAGSRPADAAQEFSRAYDQLLVTDNRHGALRVGLDLSNALFHAGHRDRAFETLMQVVEWAADAGAETFIFERREELGHMYSAALKQLSTGRANKPMVYLQRLLSRQTDGPRDVPQKQALTERERSIIEFIAGGQSNKQIARTLGVTPETVKTHLKRIFVKLSAETRAQAVVRAQSLGLLRGAVVG